MMIYFIQAGKNGPIKIGQTENDVENRIKQLQTGCPYKLKVVWLYYGDRWTEAALHERFASDRIRGEWFNSTEKLFTFIDEELTNTNDIVLENQGGTLITISEGKSYFNISGSYFEVTESYTNGGPSVLFSCAKFDIEIDPLKNRIKHIVKAGKTLYPVEDKK